METHTRVGIMLQVLADRISSSQTAIFHYERGTRSVSLETLIEIARELRKPLSYFLGVHDEIMVIKGTTSYEIAKGIDEHPEHLDLLKQLGDYVRWQRSRSWVIWQCRPGDGRVVSAVAFLFESQRRFDEF